jgi:two-component system, response regulator
MTDEHTRIVLVDDDPDDVDVALRAARRAHLPVEITVFRDGRQALDALGANGSGAESVRPRAIFLDLRMPRIDGWEVLRQLRADPKTRDIPVIIQSWSMQQEDIARCYALGANSFVAKRLTPENPGFYFSDAVRYWIQLNQTSSSARQGR